jgi:mitogen-activated protein kinase kinase kinase
MLLRFENSAEYTLDNIDLRAFVESLAASDHFLVYTGVYETEGTYIIGDPSLIDHPDIVRQILVRCFSNETQGDAPDSPDHPMHYALLLTNRDPFVWSGRVMSLDLNKADFDLREKRCRLVSDGPAARLARSKRTFVDMFPAFRRNIVIEQKAHLATVNRETRKIGRAIFRLAETVLGAFERVRAVSLRRPGQGQELLGSYFTFAADLGTRSLRYLEPALRNRFLLALMKFSIQWIAFICDDCVPTDPRTFKWAVAALEFAMGMTKNDNILKFGEDEFALLRSKVASCMTLLISHFDILGARSSYEAKKEQERIDAARLQTKQQLAARLAALKETRRKEDDEDEESIGSLQMAWEQRLEAIKALEESRAAVESGGRAVGRVLDHNLAEDRSLAFLASSSLSNISLRWQQGKFIGGGAFGNVYLAVNLDSGEELAVKEIRFQDLQSAPHLVKTIRDEMKVMEMLRHDNIVQYYGIEVHRDKVYIFEEYCPGGSLANLLEHGRIEDEIIIQIYALQLLSGLIYLHSQNVVHRDIKPDSSFTFLSFFLSSLRSLPLRPQTSSSTATARSNTSTSAPPKSSRRTKNPSPPVPAPVGNAVLLLSDSTPPHPPFLVLLMPTRLPGRRCTSVRRRSRVRGGGRWARWTFGRSGVWCWSARRGGGRGVTSITNGAFLSSVLSFSSPFLLLLPSDDTPQSPPSPSSLSY